jgi:mono/diheme cytochrome c family protein
MTGRQSATLAFAAAALLVVAAAATFAWLVTPSPAPEQAPVPGEAAQPRSGAALFARHCAGCHTLESLTTVLGARDPVATRQAWAALLTHHGATSDTEDRAVLEFLMTPPSVESLDNRRGQ